MLISISLAVFLALPPGGTFVDDNGNVHEGAIEAIAAEGITTGCNPPTNNRFCPDDPISRGAMSALIVRALDLPGTGTDFFRDDNGHIFEDAINALAAAGITHGCRPPQSTEFCVGQTVTRGSLAAIFSRAFDYPAGPDKFHDDDGHLFEDAINRLAAAGISKGCNPPSNTQFCPDRPITRAQFAAFLSRALGLQAIKPPPAPNTPPPGNNNPPPPDNAPPPPAPPPGAELTGDVCVGPITGNATLVGNISLTCDLTVNGGVLFARSGVNLDGNGHQIMIMNGGSVDWQGSPTFTWSGDGSNANLARDINFTDLSRVMFMNGAGKSTIRYVRIANVGVSEELGFYPLHWHLNGDTTRGTLVEGVVVENSANHAFVPHGSHGITFRNTIAKDIIREAYWWDPGFATDDILYDHVLADGVDYPRALGDIAFHHRVSAFFLGQGDGNVVRNSVSRNTDGGSDCSGFQWPEFDHDVWSFTDNASYEPKCHGIFVWQNDSLDHVVDGYFSNSGVSHGAYVNVYQFKDLNVDYVIQHALGRGEPIVYDGGNLGEVSTASHSLTGSPVIFRNLHMDSFTVANGGGQAGIYWLENTNLSCGDINYSSVAPGTQVRVNGSNC